MSLRGGDIRQCKINAREFDIAGESSVNIILAGYNNETKATGNGEVATTQKRKLGGFTDLVISSKDIEKDLEYLQNICDSATLVPVILTVATGKTYSGSLCVEGEIKKETASGQITISMLGKKFEQI
jgi:hypothetical protein